VAEGSLGSGTVAGGNPGVSGSNRTEGSIVIAATPPRVMQVIADLEAYPQWSEGVQDVTILDQAAGRALRAQFRIDAGVIRDTCELEYAWDGDHGVRWSLARASVLKAMDGSYDLRPHDDGTTVTYRLAVDLTIPMISMLRSKAERVIVDQALRGLKKRVEAER
jgi:ribosome-associated toxin RatA of RatAB toxin-antitoxin module